MLGVSIVFAADAVVVKRLAWTPGGLAFPFGRMLQDGLVKRYLDDPCPDAKLRLCDYKDELPRDGDTWFWASPLFDQLGRFEGLGAEMETIALDASYDYAVAQAKSALVASIRQLVTLRTGEGVLNSVWHSYSIVERFTPQLVPAMRAAHQQPGELGFETINRLHVPVNLIAMAALPVIVLLARRRHIPGALGDMAAFVALAVPAKAFVCGALSNPHDRYGARIVWLAVLAAVKRRSVAGAPPPAC